MPPIIPKSVLEDIRLRSDIADVIESYFHLQKAGTAAFKANCPFHKEKTPSFHVNQQRQIFHCFGCGAGGDVFKFVMLYESLEFMGAVRLLAERAGIPIRLEQDETPASDKTILYTLHAEAAALFHEFLLKSPAAQAARAYLEKRKLPGAIADEFLIGYAPEQWEFLVSWAQKKSYPLPKLEAAGLVIRSDKPGARTPFYDRFRHRLMFPIRNEQGRIVAFSGRALGGDAQTAKYVNSPETPIFRKSHVLYALDKARKDIVDKREAIVCEGQIDVIRCHEAGFRTAVAAQGTAFTEDHARMLRRYADGVILMFDPDEAGRNAAIRASTVFMQAGLAVRIATLPTGEDPDAFIIRQGAAAFQQVLDQAVSALDFQINVLMEREDIRTETGLMRVSRAVLAAIAQTPNAVQRDMLIQQVAARLHVSADALRADLNPMLKRSAPPAASPAPPAKVAPQPREEVALVEHLVASPDLATLITAYLPLTMITDPPCRALIEAVIASQATGRDLMDVVAEQDDDARQASAFAAKVIEAPSKAGADAPHAIAVQSLILALWRAELQRRRKDLERQSTSLTDEARYRLLAGETYRQLTLDLNRLQRWETAPDIIKLYMMTRRVE